MIISVSDKLLSAVASQTTPLSLGWEAKGKADVRQARSVSLLKVVLVTLLVVVVSCKP